MIPINFSYYKPNTLQQASNVYSELLAADKSPVFYGSGSEIISMSRVGSISPGAVIDIKVIPECNVLKLSDNRLFIGSTVTLSRITESKCFPLLGTTVARIADHTNQCRITIGGNVCGTIIYKESILPLFLADCLVVIQGIDGTRTVKISEVFNQTLLLNKGDLIVQFIIDKEYLNLPYIHVKKTKNEKIDYPLLTVAAIKKEGLIRVAFSGICGFPFRTVEIEDILNDSNLSITDKSNKICENLPVAALGNIAGSPEYKLFVLRKTLDKILNGWMVIK